jgi:hypothetical protein
MSDVSEVRITLHRATLGEMSFSRPKRLSRALAYQAADLEPSSLAETCASEEDFKRALRESRSTDRLVELWRKQLTAWDYLENADWSTASARTDARRNDVYDRLEVDTETRKLLDSLIPVFKSEGPVVISDTHAEWYSTKGQHGRQWYWPKYREFLSTKGWSEQSISELDVASNNVVERLADPSGRMVYQSRGLVVGHVQSGKTANFSGVTAKAIDAGYRLVIILSGTLNLLRAQTQRRIDMELVGRENILRGASEFEADYADDPDWVKGGFAAFGALPSTLGAFDIVRMTTRVDDYKSLLQGIVALEFEKQEPALPLFDDQNLHRASARLMVVKKNKSVLTKLVKDLNKIKTPLSEIPVLIIDDEADEASVNTARPDKDRTAINQKISELLNLLPRAQYVGYTATPYANVFVDPSDAEDIYPKDFIISLQPPAGYMGAQDFHDLDSPLEEEEKNVENSNEKAHVRDIVAQDDDASSLQEALDMYVLSAAMKLYREERGGLGPGHFLHHTMLIHESVRTMEHRELLGRVSKLWWDAGYTGPRGQDRLRRLFESDVLPVSRVRAEGQSVPSDFTELAPYIGPAVFRIGGDNNPIIVVNGDKDIETGEADFDKRSIWKILIGGQKLARGFTVEGLTVSYFRRSANNASTLMQMGRWFGFRTGYRDLVRLYLGREEKAGGGEIDLYTAFEAICLDEEAFRSELRQYARLVDGEPQIRPKDVPPLVSAHLPRIKPTSTNKMYNARLVERASAGLYQEPVAYPISSRDLLHNTELWRPVLEKLSAEVQEFSHPGDGRTRYRFSALTTRLDADELLELLSGLRWSDEGKFLPHLAFIRKITESSTRKVDDWVVLAPQHVGANKRFRFDEDGRGYSWFSRGRRRDTLFGVIRDPKHVPVARRIAGALSDPGNPATEHRSASHRGALLLYPVVEPDGSTKASPSGDVDLKKLVMAFGFVAPAAAQSNDDRVVRFETIDSAKGPIIDSH